MLRNRTLAVAAFLFSFIVPAQAAVVSHVSDEALAPLRAVQRGGRVRLDGLPLYDSQRSAVDLEEFAVWAEGGKVLIHNDNGTVAQDPAPARYFRGKVNDDPESFAFFALDLKTRRIQGMIVTRDAKFALVPNRRPKTDRMAREGAETEPGDDYFLTRFEDADEAPNGDAPTWECELDKFNRQTPPARQLLRAPSATSLEAPAVQTISGSQSYAITLEVETDFDLYSASGSNTTNLQTYITNLTGAMATVYKRDLNTDVRIKTLNIYTSNAVDPWTATDSNNGLNELGDNYHNTSIKPNGRTTSSVVMLSGVNYGGGIAWEGVIGTPDFVAGGHWGGPYAWCGGIANLGTVGLGAIPDVNTSPYNMPAGTQNYWPLTEYAHELGHNMGGHHTHCVAITDAERTQAGFTDSSANNSTSNFVDHCYGSGGTGCYTGATYAAGSAGTYKGTIMSYCHNVRVSNVPQSRFTFGQSSEPSHHELDDYMLRAAGSLNGFSNIVSSNAITITTFTKPASVVAGSTGNAASVVVTPGTGATYFWEITNGTITGGQFTSAITFTAGTTGTATLKVSVYASNLAGVTDSASIPVNAACTNAIAPTNAVTFFSGATQGSISVTSGCAWTAVSNNAFITVTGGATGSGNGTVTYTVSANGTGSQRVGTITVAGLTYTITQKSIAVKRGDLDFDGSPDVLWRNNVTGENVAWFLGSNGQNVVGGAGFYTVADLNWKLAAAGDFNSDGAMDLVWRNTSTGQVTIWLMNGLTRIGVADQPNTATAWSIEATGDFNSDGKTDIVWHNHANGMVVIWLMNNTTLTAGAEVSYTSDPNWHVAGAGDFNGDGKTDLVWRHATTGRNVFWQLNGTTIVTGVDLDTEPDTNWRVVACADYDGDGTPDLWWHNVSNGFSAVWYLQNFKYKSGASATTLTDFRWEGAGPK